MTAFGISVNRASTNLNHYLGMAPGSTVYDTSPRTYVRGARFSPIFLKRDADRYLSELRSTSGGILTQEETRICRLPAFDTMLSPIRGIDAGNLHAVDQGTQRANCVKSITTGCSERRFASPLMLGV